jgi:hypothetical protein
MTVYDSTPMRDEFMIKDRKKVELINEIFTLLDQPWVDVTAYELALLLERHKGVFNNGFK